MPRSTLSGFAVVAVVMIGMVGCRHDPRPADDPSTLVVAMSTFSESTFLPWNGSTGRKLYLDTIYDYLVYIDPDTGALQPGLAERWEASADGRTHTFHVRPGVQFQSGWGELTAADAQFTIERIMAPDAIAGPSSPLRKLVERVTAPDRYTLVIQLRDPDIEFARAYLSNGLVVPIVCERYVREVGDDTANRQPIGTGAFTLVSHSKDAEIVLRARDDPENLWRVQPDFAAIRFLSVPEDFTRVAMLRAGEIDLAPINFDSIRAIADADLQVLYVPQTWAPVIRLGGLAPMFPNTAAPWADRRVRQALNYAIDKAAIVATIFHNHAVAAGVDFPSRDFAGIDPYPYDPARARALLREAGYPDGFELTIRTYTTMPGAELPIIAEIVALYWNVIGVRTTIEPTSWIALRGIWSTGKATEIAWTHRGFAFTTALAGLQSSTMADSVFAGYADAATEDYLRRLRDSLDVGERQRIAGDIGRYLRDQAAYVYIAFADEPFGASRKVGHWPALREQGTNIDQVTRRTD